MFHKDFSVIFDVNSIEISGLVSRQILWTMLRRILSLVQAAEEIIEGLYCPSTPTCPMLYVNLIDCGTNMRKTAV